MRTLLFAAVAAIASPLGAQAQQIERRVDRLESEMRAVQRKVFPSGAGRLVEPEIQPQTAPVEAAPGVPASTPLADLNARVATLEQQIATLTGQIEQGEYRLRQLDEAFQAYKRTTDERLRATEASPAAAPGPDAGAAEAEPQAQANPLPDPPPPTAVERPRTGDAAEDAYAYGYRLWEAKQYVAAEKQLKEVVAKYPRHRRASYAQNLLGRTYLDQGKPSLASIAFYDNYKRMPEGERAPYSLYFLAQALQTLKKPEDACKVYGELTDVYGAKIDARLKADIAKGRAAARCGA